MPNNSLLFEKHFFRTFFRCFLQSNDTKRTFILFKLITKLAIIRLSYSITLAPASLLRSRNLKKIKIKKMRTRFSSYHNVCDRRKVPSRSNFWWVTCTVHVSTSGSLQFLINKTGTLGMQRGERKCWCGSSQQKAPTCWQPPPIPTSLYHFRVQLLSHVSSLKRSKSRRGDSKYVQNQLRGRSHERQWTK